MANKTTDLVEHDLRLKLTGIVPASGTIEVEAGPALNIEHWSIHTIAFEDETSAATDGRLYTDGTFGRMYWRQWTTLAADTIYNEMRAEFHVSFGEKVGVRVTGATSGDIIRLYLGGHRYLEA